MSSVAPSLVFRLLYIEGRYEENFRRAAIDYRVGDRALYNAIFSGWIPVKVVEVLEPGCGWEAGVGKIRAVVTKTGHGYTKGKVVVLHADDCVPIKHRYIPDGGIFYRIKRWYRWVP